MNTTNETAPNMIPIPCHRCDGKGIIPGYRHVQNGMCWRCDGAGYTGYRKATTRAPLKSQRWMVAVTDTRDGSTFYYSQQGKTAAQVIKAATKTANRSRFFDPTGATAILERDWLAARDAKQAAADLAATI